MIAKCFCQILLLTLLIFSLGHSSAQAFFEGTEDSYQKNADEKRLRNLQQLTAYIEAYKKMAGTYPHEEADAAWISDMKNRRLNILVSDGRSYKIFYIYREETAKQMKLPDHKKQLEQLFAEGLKQKMELTYDPQKYDIGGCARGYSYTSDGEHYQIWTQLGTEHPGAVKQPRDRCFAYSISNRVQNDSGQDPMNKGLLFAKKGLFKEAAIEFSKAIEIHPENTDAYYHRGSVYLHENLLEQAMSDMNKSIELDPKNTDAYYLRGVTYQKKKDLDQALMDYDKAIELKPLTARFYNDRALVYLMKGNSEKGLENINKAIEIEPENPARYRNRALVYFKTKDYEKCWNDVKKNKDLGGEISPDFLKDLKEASGREK